MSLVLTVISDPSRPTLSSKRLQMIAQAAADVAGTPPGEVDWLSPGTACDIPIEATNTPTGPMVEAARQAAAIGHDEGDLVDIAVLQRAGRRKRLLIADMDSTIVTGETLDDLAELAGVGEAVKAITARAMNGELDFAGALRERVAMLAGRPAALLEEALRALHVTPGAYSLVRTMRAHDARCILVSGGFTYFTGHVRNLVGFDADHGNTLILEDDYLTGAVGDPILGKDTKLATLRTEAAALGLSATDVLAVGDGANDLPMLLEAGLGVAFQAKPTVRAEARVAVNIPNLKALLYLQGYRDSEIAPDTPN